MKIVKMSLVAALLAGTSVFAIDNVKTSGDINVFYHTQDTDMTPNTLSGESASLFGKDSSAADAGLNLAISADLAKNDLVKVSGNAALTVLSTLGLENNFVSNVWGTSHAVTAQTGATYAGSDHGDAFGGAKVENSSWMSEAYVTFDMQAATKTTVMLGRMPLDTPIAFTETWSIEKNTFEGAAVINKDLPDTTIVGAYVGNGNGSENLGQDVNGTVAANSLGMGGVVNEDGQFTTFGTDGAYALGVVNNSYKPLTAQFWYYDVTRVAEAMWAQADLNMDGILAGAQYATLDFDGSSDTGTAMAVMVGYEMKDTVTVKAAYSQTDDTVGILGNAATTTADSTGLTYRGQSKLYTEAWWNYGNVTLADTSAINVTIESPVNGLFDLGIYATMIDVPTDGEDITEVTATAGKDFGPLNATLAYIMTSPEEGDSTNMIQAYLSLAF